MEQHNLFNNQRALPNAQTVLVLGIISIATCIFYGLPGLVCGIIAIVLSNKDLKLYNDHPDEYTANSYSNLKAGRTCAIIGTILGALFIVLLIVYIAFIGTFFMGIIHEAMKHH